MKNTVRLCGHCLFGVKSREGNIPTRSIDVNEADVNESKCDLCEEAGFSVLYEIIKDDN